MTVDCDVATAHGGDPVLAGDTTRLRIGILGENYDAVVVDALLYDPKYDLVRA